MGILGRSVALYIKCFSHELLADTPAQSAQWLRQWSKKTSTIKRSPGPNESARVAPVSRAKCMKGDARNAYVLQADAHCATTSGFYLGRCRHVEKVAPVMLEFIDRFVNIGQSRVLLLFL